MIRSSRFREKRTHFRFLDRIDSNKNTASANITGTGLKNEIPAGAHHNYWAISAIAALAIYLVSVLVYKTYNLQH